MKVLFLDFDGVITIPPQWNLNPDKIKYIKTIVESTDAKIVISSSWRRRTVKETIESIRRPNKRCPENELIHWLMDNLYDVTPMVSDKKYMGNGRGGEIQSWLDSHPDVDNYVIIDDDYDMMDQQLFHFVQTNYEDGITELETNWCIKILNKKYFQNSMAINFELRRQWCNKCQNLENRVDEIWKYNDHCKDMNCI